MSRKLKIRLIAAISLILTGGIVFVITMMNLRWDFSKLSTMSRETNEYTINEEFHDISIQTSTANVKFLPSEDDGCNVVCYEAKKEKHSVSVEDGVLTIRQVDTRKWYDHINFFDFGATEITVYLPRTDLGTLAVDQSTGDITLPEHTSFERVEIQTTTGHIVAKNVTAGDIKCSVSTGHVVMEKLTCSGDIGIDVTTGDVKLTDATCRSFVSTGSTGALMLKNVVASDKYFIERSTGNVTLDGCDAAEIYVTTDTGDIKGSLLTDKIFIARTDTGRIDVPETAAGGKCKVTTNTGNIQFR